MFCLYKAKYSRYKFTNTTKPTVSMKLIFRTWGFTFEVHCEKNQILDILAQMLCIEMRINVLFYSHIFWTQNPLYNFLKFFKLKETTINPFTCCFLKFYPLSKWLLVIPFWYQESWVQKYAIRILFMNVLYINSSKLCDLCAQSNVLAQF